MNKRQKKKNAKRATMNILSKQSTAKDWHIVNSYGKKHFFQITGMTPSSYNFLLDGKLSSMLAEAVKYIKNTIGNAFIEAGNAFKIGDEDTDAIEE